MSEIIREALINYLHKLVPNYFGEHFFDNYSIWTNKKLEEYTKGLKNDKKSKEKTLFEAFTKGFTDGMATIISVFDIPSEDVKDKLHSIGLVTIRISELYHLWMGF